MAEESGRDADIETREADVAGPRAAVVRRGATFESFRYRSYTLFWSGAFLSNTGTWMQNYALSIVVFAFRRSELDLGIVNFVAGVPTLLLALVAGVMADRVDRRRLVIWGQVVLLVQAAALGYLYNSGTLSSAHPSSALVWVGSLGLVAGVVTALTFPAWQAMLPDLVPRRSLMNAIALNSAQFQSARLLGPLVAGAIVLAGAGMGEVFYANAVSFLFVIGALMAVRLTPPDEHSARPVRGSDGSIEDAAESAWHTLTAGLRYAWSHRVAGLLILSTAFMTIFGMPYMMLLTAIVDRSLGFPPGTPGYSRYTAFLMAANGLGALVGSLAVASLPKDTRRERIIPLSLAAMAVILIGFALSRTVWLSMVLSVLAGAAVLTANSLTNTSIQASVPGHLRGRVMALFIMSFMGLMPVSSIVFGALGKVIGPSPAVLVGAVVLLAWSLVLVARPGWLQTPRQRREGG